MPTVVIGTWAGVLIFIALGEADYAVCYALGALVCWISSIMEARRTGHGGGDE